MACRRARQLAGVTTPRPSLVASLQQLQQPSSGVHALRAAVAPPASRAFSSNVQVVFNTEAKKRQRNRAAAEADSAEYDYLRDEVARRMVDRLNDITRQFPVAVELGANSGNVLKALDGKGGIKTLHMIEPAERMLMRDADSWKSWAPGVSVVPHVRSLEGSPLPFETGSVDIVLSSMALHWVNDLPGLLREAKRVLKPDGVFLASMLGGDSLEELRSSFVVAEQERDGGVSPHASPMVMVSDAGNLLQGAGFGIPTVDTDVFTIEYPTAARVFDHMRAMGDSSVTVGTRQGAHPDVMLAAAAAYHGLFANPEDNSVPVTYQVIHMIGWAPAPSQPKPKARGSVPKGFGVRMPAAGASAAGGGATTAAAGARTSCSREGQDSAAPASA